MQLIDQHTKRIMEGCKERARAAGLRFQDETLEYIVTNRDLLELSPKMMIPTLYDYWVHEVEVLKEKGKYELYPSNPYETVINTRPAISFYNDNNPDWLNVMIFYHVLAHIDFFQNNLYFRHTWDFDLAGEALADKRLIARLRAEHGRWVDYVIEFARAIDNQAGYFQELSQLHRTTTDAMSHRLNYYFDVFIQSVKQVKVTEFIKEVERYNHCMRTFGKQGENTFFAEVAAKHPEFEALFAKSQSSGHHGRLDLLQFIMKHSPYLNRDENKWMKSVIEVVRKTSIYFQPQIRTKIMNEGWASYWHETLFLLDERIRGHEVEFARVHSGVTSLPRVGLNPYALGMRLFQHIEELADKGKLTFDYQRLLNAEARKSFDTGTGKGRDFIFTVRENCADFLFLSTYVDQEFVDRHRLFVAGKRLNKAKMSWEYYVKSRSGQQYRQMLLDTLYHPPAITIDETRTGEGLYLIHRFEGKPLVEEFIANTMMGIEFFWGNPVRLETSEVASAPQLAEDVWPGMEEARVTWRKVLYTMQDRHLTKSIL
ncbi:stage V sporulation protein R [Geobacter sp. OR-1]|uniref:SpoVR family protein n=1 Tax=Geobacter sp. OR-1 TaxID=1266765 RepID=UPI000542E459|nr:SpoVR family protein [Geobacter sp. OR-1]GAM08525.1 stage V sporulation protein R [Geobacter sp. OR-1]